MTEHEWIVAQQLPNGAIVNRGLDDPERPEELAVNPYFANFAALGLVQSGRPELLDAARRWMTWYFDHMNRPDVHGFTGTVYDYHVTLDDVESPTLDYDSIDSYASTFLNLALEYWRAGGDHDFVRTHEHELREVAEVMVAIMDADDLTWAKPGWMTKYLMDNSEVYAGFGDAAELWQLAWPEDVDTRERWLHWQERSRRAIMERLDDGNGDFLVSLSENGDRLVRRWGIWYADATSSVFPALWGVIPPDHPRAVAAWNKLNESFPNWPELETGDSFPWCIIGYAAVVMGDLERARRMRDAVRREIVDAGRPSGRWYCAEAGWLARIEAALAA